MKTNRMLKAERTMNALAGESVKKLLNAKTLGRTIYFYERVGSTNDLAFQLAKSHEPEGTVVIADFQTNGRGRLERKWISPPGVNLYVSAVLRPHIPAKDASFLTLVSSIALVGAIRGEGVKAVIKWPNDALVNGKKISGILAEMQPAGDMVDFVVVGIGVNLNMTKEMIAQEMAELAGIATSISEAAGREINRAKFAARLIDELEIWYRVFLEDGKLAIIKEWTKRWGAINRRVRVHFDKRTVEGTGTGIDENGHLIVECDDGAIEKIVAGDLILL